MYSLLYQGHQHVTRLHWNLKELGVTLLSHGLLLCSSPHCIFLGIIKRQCYSGTHGGVDYKNCCYKFGVLFYCPSLVHDPTCEVEVPDLCVWGLRCHVCSYNKLQRCFLVCRMIAFQDSPGSGISGISTPAGACVVDISGNDSEWWGQLAQWHLVLTCPSVHLPSSYHTCLLQGMLYKCTDSFLSSLGLCLPFCSVLHTAHAMEGAGT